MEITGPLRSKVDAIRQDFYNANMAQGSDVVNQLTMLMFIKMLDDKQNALEAQAAVIGEEPDADLLTFKNGNYTNFEKVEGEKRKRFTIPYAELRWKNFKNLNTYDLSRRIKERVIPFVMDENNKAIGKFANYSQAYSYGFDGKEKLLTNIVDKLSEVNTETGKDYFNFVDTDLMGDVYEYICGSGISGQYRTPRHLISMAVEMMKPKLGEKIIDPACGTMGFPYVASKYIQEHEKEALLNKENNKKFNNETFYGVDNDTNMARIGYMNMILHNVKNPNISTNSLLEGENLTSYEGKYDICLQNPPFSAEFEKTSVNGKLLSLCDARKSELLFVALMVKLLKIGGRGMSVVPDGVLFGSSAAHISIRKELVEHQKLVGVISMPQGIFMAPSKKGSSSKGAGVKTSFIIFEKTDNGGTDDVWFYDMKNDGFTLDAKRQECEGSDIPDVIKAYEKLIQEKAEYKALSDEEKEEQRKGQWFFVPKESIAANNYDLTINKYKVIEKPPVEYRSTDEIIADIKNVSKEESAALDELCELLCKEETR